MPPMNPLQAGGSVPPIASGAPPAAGPAPMQRPPMMPAPPAPAPDVHAMIGQHIAGLDLDPIEMAKEAKLATYGSAAFAKLAKDPNIKPKDIIKVASDAVADKIIPADKAIALITQMPSDETKLHAFVKNLALSTMTTAVHLKAQMIRAAQPTPVAAAAPAAPPPGAPQ